MAATGLAENTRYYSRQLCQNLFGEWVVVRRWGKISALEGRSLEHTTCSSYEEGRRLICQRERRRFQRSYKAI